MQSEAVAGRTVPRLDQVRRLEFSRELLFSDGTVARSPGELMALAQAVPDRVQEVLRFLQEGSLERWLIQLGWMEAAQRVAALRNRPPAAALLLQELRPILGGALPTAEVAPAPDWPPAQDPEQPSGQSAVLFLAGEAARELLQRQRQVLELLDQASRVRAQQEKEAPQQYAAASRAVEAETQAALSQLQSDLEDLRGLWNASRSALEQWGLGHLLQPAGAPGSAGPAVTPPAWVNPMAWAKAAGQTLGEDRSVLYRLKQEMAAKERQRLEAQEKAWTAARERMEKAFAWANSLAGLLLTAYTAYYYWMQGDRWGVGIWVLVAVVALASGAAALEKKEVPLRKPAGVALGTGIPLLGALATGFAPFSIWMAAGELLLGVVAPSLAAQLLMAPAEKRLEKVAVWAAYILGLGLAACTLNLYATLGDTTQTVGVMLWCIGLFFALLMPAVLVIDDRKRGWQLSLVLSAIGIPGLGALATLTHPDSIWRAWRIVLVGGLVFLAIALGPSDSDQKK